MDRQEQAIRRVCRRIAPLPFEVAYAIFPDGKEEKLADGDENALLIPPAMLSRLAGAVLIHNHPLGLPPSPQDLHMAITFGLSLMVVTGPVFSGAEGGHRVFMLRTSLRPDQAALAYAELRTLMLMERQRLDSWVRTEGDRLTATAAEHQIQMNAWARFLAAHREELDLEVLSIADD